jgi:transposase, IS6 family
MQPYSNGAISKPRLFSCVCVGISDTRLRYRDLEEMMLERGLSVDHTTIYRWVQLDAPELEKRCRPHLKTTNDSWRVDETYRKVKGVWTYLYRAVDSPSGTRWSFC